MLVMGCDTVRHTLFVAAMASGAEEGAGEGWAQGHRAACSVCGSGLSLLSRVRVRSGVVMLAGPTM